MKRLLLLVFTTGMMNGLLQAQDIPLFSQKLTNSFMYNPAVAGHNFGSATFSYRKNYSQVAGAPVNYFLSMHTPIAKHRAGVGGNIYQEDVTFIRNTYASLAFAYHIRFDKFTTFSMGVSGEYNSMGTNGAPIADMENDDLEYNALLQGRMNTYDFSFGMLYQNRFMKAGISANRLANAWIEEQPTLSNYYSAFAQGLIPVRGGEDLLEPYVAYRKLSEVNNTLDLGLFYTYNNVITAGASWRSGGVVGGTVAVRPTKFILVGYSHEIITGNVGGFVGSANEITLRLDFKNEDYKERFRADYKSSVSYRRKTISSGKPGSSSPHKLHSKQKKVVPYSPNKRYQNIKKLGVKKSSNYKKNYSSKRKKKRSPPKKRR
ncbi:MAG TPA: PorP/SprF family type IX secretion system membrane protein [Ohtaekwangia sp.]